METMDQAVWGGLDDEGVQGSLAESHMNPYCAEDAGIFVTWPRSAREVAGRACSEPHTCESVGSSRRLLAV